MRIIVNPNKNFTGEMRGSLKNNNGYCPCKIQKNDDNKCMCKEFREQTENGWCHCMLYYKEMEIDVR